MTPITWYAHTHHVTNPQVLPTSTYKPDPVEFAKERIPEFTGDNAEAKRKYLTYRVFDFGKGDAAGLCKLTIKTINRWREQDAEFRTWEDVKLKDLRKDLQVQYTTSQFYRNMQLALELDYKVLSKAVLEGQDTLSAEEHQYLMRVRARYGADSLINMLRVASGDLAITGGQVLINTVVISGPGGEVLDAGAD